MSQMKKRQVTLTGSDEVRMKDKKHTQLVCENLWKRRQDSQEREEKRRAEAERDRLRRLLAQGLIQPEDMQGDSFLYTEYLKKEQAKNKHRRGGKKNKAGKTAHFEESPREIEYRQYPQSPMDLKPSDSPPPRRRPYNPASQRHSARSDNARVHDEEQDGNSDGEVQSQMAKVDGDENEGDEKRDTTENGDGEPNQEDDGVPRQADGPLLIQLRREETVTGLYEIAEGLVYLTAANKKSRTQKQQAG